MYLQFQQYGIAAIDMSYFLLLKILLANDIEVPVELLKLTK